MTLLRREIGRRLAAYYAQSAELVVGCLPPLESVPLRSLWGEWHWKRTFRNMYRSQKGQWLTPVELFKPFYSNIVASFIARSLENTTGSAEIVELGGGRGTNAHQILNYLHDYEPDIYSRVSYRIFDSSPSLLDLQRESLLATIHAEKIELIEVDLLAVAEGEAGFLDQATTPTTVIALELLDNLPHDKIRVRSGIVEQACVKHAEDGCSLEYFEPLNDKLLKDVILTAPSYKRHSVGWVPTVACGVLKSLYSARPQASLLCADFDWLPAPDPTLQKSSPTHRSTWAVGEPLVTSMQDVDYECYLNAPVLSDILFPTDFTKLAAF